MSVLGRGKNTAHIYTRDGVTHLLDLPGTTLKWRRALCGVSTAEVTVPPARCVPELDRVHPWAHSLVIHRDEGRQWEGPLRKREDTSKGMTLTASDVAGWMDRRPVRTARLVVASPALTEMQWAIDEAFATDDPNVLAHVQDYGTGGGTLDVEVVPGEKYLAEVLTGAVAAGGMFTVAGRSIILWDDTTVIGSLGDLSPENHLNADVSIIEDGDALAVEAWARNDDGVTARATADGLTVDPFYGHVGIVTTSTALKPAGVLRTAQRAVKAGWPAPVTVSIPDSATLRCDAPFTIDQLIPGVLVPISTVTATGREVRATMMLSAVEVTQEPGKDETVTISLSTAGVTV